jgi:hypothetical protein
MLACAGAGLIAGVVGGFSLRGGIRDGRSATPSAPVTEVLHLGATVPDLPMWAPAASEVRGVEDSGRAGGLQQELTPLVAPPAKPAPPRLQRPGSRPTAAERGEKVTAAPAALPSTAVRATERDQNGTDASDIVDWFINEFPRRR